MWYPQSSIGHAVIRIDDFLAQRWDRWEMLNTAIEPGSHPQNVGGCWTGSIIKRRDERYYYYYTAADGDFPINKKQRILCAVSSDLTQWDTNPGIKGIEMDYKRYEQYQGSSDRERDLAADHWYDESWRDPFVFTHDGKTHALITARVNETYFSQHSPGATDFRRRGCIAHAIYDETGNWEIQDPVYLPRTAPELEVPQFVKRDKWFYLLFSAHPQNWVDGPHVDLGGTFYVKSANPFKFEGHGQPLHATNTEKCYSGRLLDINGDLFFIAHYHTHNKYGGLIEPIPVTVDSNGNIHLE